MKNFILMVLIVAFLTGVVFEQWKALTDKDLEGNAA